jgi:nicotinate-nucleotide pyrophosphorylase (carboxylating)
VHRVPLAFTNEERDAATRLVDLALAEDLGTDGDLTSKALIPETAAATVNVVARADGILAGVPVGQMVFERLDPAIAWDGFYADGTRLTRGAVVATVSGPLRSLLAGERTVLNFLMHLSGVASLTRKFVDAVAGTKAVILDTRKTLPGWRRLEKYAVRAGGGTNHRLGLADGCLIKDNHLAAWRANDSCRTISAALAAARSALPASLPLEVEVDTIEQLSDALAGQPDIVLLDNMDAATLRKCVRLRDTIAPHVLLEASGGVTLATVATIAETGVDRISVGAITHSAPALDLAFDWL